ncbi:hypothetical protein [Thiomicrorhabdus indica]|uniref:hypothetical protein n=1 Tax=Thiomicrorhabdus indica TaxID=2267253 RepID=UPI002AA842E7|nr:hypothetical protein [Thiomicrorhabdus indica]
MNKFTKVVGIIALASVTGLAVAGGYGCGMKGEQFSQKAEYCQMMKGERQGFHHKMHHGKSCDAKFGHQKNMTAEKREALMQLKVENKLERMTRHLDLTAEQQSEIRSIMQATQQKKFELKQQVREQIDKVLTDEQKQQREAFRQSHRKS